ncbi:hypothetical protein [uncultured Microscilla sp.]|uniref:hypothetical protein n=1 Tax=uncultured Microscilla sp. TaxID=432653 RepID=UPI00263A15FF|nr:hypothetical protein [uncultured Microscilla sp.]
MSTYTNNPNQEQNNGNTHNQGKVKTQLNHNQVSGNVNIENTQKDQVKGNKVIINNVNL